MGTLGTFYKTQMKFELTMEDFTIIQNALHYYKHIEKRGHFSRYDVERINQLRDKLSYQMIPSFNSKDGTVPSSSRKCK